MDRSVIHWVDLFSNAHKNGRFWLEMFGSVERKSFLEQCQYHSTL